MNNPMSAGPTSPERETHVSHNAEHQHICADHGVETWRCGHTPGPWVIGADPVRIYGGPKQNRLVATVGYSPDSERANARLIAAAPETARKLAEVTAQRDSLRADRDMMAGQIQYLRETNAELREACKWALKARLRCHPETIEQFDAKMIESRAAIARAEREAQP